MADIEEAFAALESLDDEGRRALALITSMLQEKLAEAKARGDKAAWLLSCIREWAANWGLEFALEAASDEWDAKHGARSYVPISWFEAHVDAARREALSELNAELHAAEAERDRLRQEMRGLRTTLTLAWDETRRMTGWARAECVRASALRAQRAALLEEVERLKTILTSKAADS